MPLSRRCRDGTLRVFERPYRWPAVRTVLAGGLLAGGISMWWHANVFADGLFWVIATLCALVVYSGYRSIKRVHFTTIDPASATVVSPAGRRTFDELIGVRLDADPYWPDMGSGHAWRQQWRIRLVTQSIDRAETRATRRWRRRIEATHGLAAEPRAQLLARFDLAAPMMGHHGMELATTSREDHARHLAAMVAVLLGVPRLDTTGEVPEIIPADEHRHLLDALRTRSKAPTHPGPAPSHVDCESAPGHLTMHWRPHLPGTWNAIYTLAATSALALALGNFDRPLLGIVAGLAPFTLAIILAVIRPDVGPNILQLGDGAIVHRTILARRRIAIGTLCIVRGPRPRHRYVKLLGDDGELTLTIDQAGGEWMHAAILHWLWAASRSESAAPMR